LIAFCSYAALSALLVGLYRWVALRYRWLDIPNQRSSHAVITPRGAGVIFALLIIGAAALLLPTQYAFFVPLVAGVIVALAGWWDDLRGTSAPARFAIYTVSSAITALVIFTEQTIALHSGFAFVVLTLWGGIATLGLVWLINLYNFMDGINGIAAAEALFVLITIDFFARDTPYAQMFSSIHLWSSAAIVGFLLWNFPAGKVFMGDAGSAFLGFFLGTLMLWSALLQGPAPVVWLILLGVFIVDSGYTLLVRLATGQPWYAAHRLHAYQRLTDRLHASHLRTVGVVMALNFFWLLPMAWLVLDRQLNAFLGLGLTYLPLIAGCYWLRAGIPAQGQV
jgi:Fuc2NAc and GlcNAc transferase